MAHRHLMTLAGGRQVVDFDNRYCVVCGKHLHSEVVCRREDGNICAKHCDICRYYIPFLQQCIYKRKPRTAKSPASTRPGSSKAGKPP